MPTSSMKKAATHSAGNSLQDAANARLEFPVRRESSTKWWTKKGTRDLTEAYLKFLYTSEAWAKGTSDAADDGPIRPVPWCPRHPAEPANHPRDWLCRASAPRRIRSGLVTPIRACGPAGGQVARGMKKISYKGYRFPLEIIQQAIWLYVRFTLSFRDVEDLLAERVSWCPTKLSGAG